MHSARALATAFLLCVLPGGAHATVFSQLQGVVHDPQHRPLSAAHIVLSAAHSSFSLSADSSAGGTFALPIVPLGDYTLTITHTGFATIERSINPS